MKRTLALILAASVLVCSRLAAEPQALQDQKAAFEKQVEAVQKENAEQHRQLAALYTNGMAKFRVQAELARQADQAAFIVAELERFGREKTPPSAAGPTPELQKLFDAMALNTRNIEARRADALLKLGNGYVASLQQMKKSLEQQARADQAAEVQRTIAAFESSAEFRGLSKAAAPKPTAAATGDGAASFDGIKLVTGKTIEVEIPLAPDAGKGIGSFYDANTVCTKMKIGIAIPPGFDPAKPQRLLVTSASTTGDGLSIKNLGSYRTAANERGWVVMATDGEFGKPKSDSPAFRANLLIMMLRRIETNWPAAKKTWTVATAGFSGGAGYASHQALLLNEWDWRIVGMLLMNSGYSPTMWEDDKQLKGSKSKLRKIPVFFSAGKNDGVAKPDLCEQTYKSTLKGGYKTSRLEWSDVAHKVTPEHMSMALEWFESLEKQTLKP